MRLKCSLYWRVIVGILCGVLARVFYDNQLIYTLYEDQLKECSDCIDRCPACPPVKVTRELPLYVQPAYKPRGMYEVTRWIYFDDTHVYDIINEEPKLDITGHWREEIKAITQVGLDYINANRMLGQQWTLVKLHNGYMRTDCNRGTDYLLDLIVKSSSTNLSHSGKDKMIRVSLVHALEKITDAKKLAVKREVKVDLKVVMPVTPDSPYIQDFLKEYVTNPPDINVQLIVVLFTGRSNTASHFKATKEAINNVMQYNPKVPIQLLLYDGAYDYYNGINFGIIKATTSTDIILAIKEDMSYKRGLIRRCRSIVMLSQRVYFPIAFSQFNPEIIEKGMPPGKPKDINKKEHNKFTGYWMHDKHDYFCSYQSDLIKILSGLSTRNLQNQKNWVYNAFLRNDIEVISAIEPKLYKVKHQRQCSTIKPSLEEYKDCFKSKAKSLGSKPALGILYINEVIQKQP